MAIVSVQFGPEARGMARFDRISWITLAIALVLLLLSSAVGLAAYNIPSDGWITDRGAWGRYTNPIFLENATNTPSNLQMGDRLLAVEGAPFEQLEAQAAALNPPRPANWKMGATIRYTVLRDGQEVDVNVTLRRAPLFALYPTSLLTDPILLSFPLFLLMGGLVFFLRPRERSAQLLFLFAFAFFNDNILTWVIVPPGVADLFSHATYWPRIVLGNVSWTYLILPLLVHLFLLFPVVKWPLRRFPRLTPLLLYGGSGIASLLYVLLNIIGYDFSGLTFSMVVAATMLLLIAGSLGHSVFTVRDPIARMQVRWVTIGGLLGVVGPVTLWVAVGGMSPLTPFWQDLLFLLLIIAMPVSLAIAILRFQLWDIEVIINRTLVYGTLTGLLALIYFGGIVSLQFLFRTLTGQESQIAVVLSTLGIAALFNPLRRRIQDAIDQHFYRRKYDAEQSLASFAATVRDEVELDRLSAALLSVVAETTQPAHLSLWLREPQVENDS